MEHQSLFSLSNPEFWVLVALVLFFGLQPAGGVVGKF